MELITSEGLDESTALERAEELIASVGDYPDTYQGRGIVICGGGLTYFTNAWVCVSMLRHVGCRLPIQLWYLGRGELDERMEELVAPLGVECIDATAVALQHPARILRGWEVKPYAILHCPFREVLLLDADNCVATDPEALFETWQYRTTGAIFWPDLGRLQPEHPSWRIFGVEYRDEPEIESGQIVVNKETCWKALCLTKHYNDYSDFYYRYVHGDKETFHFAFRKAGQPYAMPSRPTRFESGTFFQADFADSVVFQHRNGAKWNFEGDNPFFRDFHFEAECHRFVEELRVLWDGRIGRARSRPESQQLASAREELAAHLYRFARDGSAYRTMSFASDGRVSLGATATESRWEVRVSGRRIVLEIGGDDATNASCVLVRDATVWRSVVGKSQLVAVPRKLSASKNAALSLTEFVEKVEWFAGPFNWHQYALARDLSSDAAIVIGRFDSAAALAVARGMQDTQGGQVALIDPSQDAERGPSHWEAEKWFDLFALQGRVRYVRTPLDDVLPVARDLASHSVHLVVIDREDERNGNLTAFDGFAAMIDRGVMVRRREQGWSLLACTRGAIESEVWMRR
jgi:hypothetical protein